MAGRANSGAIPAIGRHLLRRASADIRSEQLVRPAYAPVRRVEHEAQARRRRLEHRLEIAPIASSLIKPKKGGDIWAHLYDRE